MKNPRNERLKSPVAGLPLTMSRFKMDGDPATNLALMETRARESDAFGKDLDFDAVRWSVGRAKATSSRVEHSIWFTEQKNPDDPPKDAEGRPPMPSEFAIFMKCTLRLGEERACSLDEDGDGLSQAELESLIRAGRYLLMALKERGETNPCNAKLADFNRADDMARTKTPWTAYNIGSHLQKLAKILSLYRLTASPVRFSTNATAPDPDERDDAQVAASLPSDEALSALRQIAKQHLEPPDIVRMAVVKLKRCAPMRINEILTLPEGCEIVVVDGLPGTLEDFDNPAGREVFYGIRYFEEKTGTWLEQFFPTEAVPIVRRSIDEVRLISAESRKIAAHYAADPNVAWLPVGLPDGEIVPVSAVGEAFWLTRTQMNHYLRRRGLSVIPEHVGRTELEAGLERERQPRREIRQRYLAAIRDLLRAKPQAEYFTVDELSIVLRYGDTFKWLRQHDVEVRPRSVRRSDIEADILSHGVKDGGLPQPLQECLFVFPHNFFRDTQSFLPRVSMLTVDHMRAFLGGVEDVESIFERGGFKRPKGKKKMKITTSMFRRLHVTNGRFAGVSAEEMRDWIGHGSIEPQQTYNCRSVEDRALEASALDDDWVAPHAEVEEIDR